MEGTDSPPWENLIPELLGLIFKNLSLCEIFTVIPAVCKSWRDTVVGPYCWQEIDIEDWSAGNDHGKVDRMLQVLITRSCGSPKELCVSGLQLESSFNFIAEHARSLRTLRLPRSGMSDSLMVNFAGKLSNLTYLDLSYCSKIGAVALEAIGKNCRFLDKLSFNVHPLHVEGKLSQNDEAHAIATTMPKLKHLEIAYTLVNTWGVLEIITNCPELEFLDLRGCWDVKLEEESLEKNFPKLTVLGPHVVDLYEKTSCDSLYDDDDDDDDDDGIWEDSDSLYDDDDDVTWEDSDGIWDDGDSLEIWYYDGNDEYTANGWPPSP